MLSKEAILSLCSEYQIGSIANVDLASAGIENLNYFIETEDEGVLRSYVLTVTQTPSYSGELYFPMMNLIQNNGLPVPAPIVDQNGNFFNSLGNQKAILQPRLAGEHLLEPNSHHINQLVELVAKLHKVPYKSLGPVSRHPRDAAWINRQTDRLNKELDGQQKQNGTLHDDLLQGILETYNAIKSISSDELEFFHSFIVFAALDFWLSRLIGQEENRDRIKDPKEMQHILKNLINH